MAEAQKKKDESVRKLVENAFKTQSQAQENLEQDEKRV